MALPGMLLTCVLALSVHVGMQQVLGVPYPVGYPTTGWPVVCSLALSALALVIVYRLSMNEFGGVSVPMRYLVLAVLTAMLREALIRLPVMDGFATTAWSTRLSPTCPG